MPRLFVAVEPPGAVLDRLEEEIAALAATGADVRWSARDHLHLTLRFLGAVPDASVDDVVALLHRCCAGAPLIDLEARGLGTFPGGRNPRVVWAGVQGTSEPVRDALFALRRRLHEGANGLGFVDERDDFRAHLTLGRVRGQRRLRGVVEHVAAGRDRPFGCFQASEVVLIESRLHPSGSVYTALEHARLGAGSGPV